AGRGFGTCVVAFQEDLLVGVVQAEFGHKYEPVHLELSREGAGEDLGVKGELDAVLVAEVFFTQGESEPGGRIEVEIGGSAVPGAAGSIVFREAAGFVE